MTSPGAEPQRTRSRLRSTLLIAAAGAALFLVPLLALDAPDATVLIDSDSRRVARDLADADVADFASLLTVLGSLEVVAVAVAIAVVALFALRRPRAAVVVALGFLLTLLAVHFVKDAVGRMRPAGAELSLSTASFPSGHAAYAVAYCAIAVALLGVRDTTRRRRLWALAGALALTGAIGLTRLLLDVHHLSDVLAGWALSAAIFGLVAAGALVIGPMRHTERRTREAPSQPSGTSPCTSSRSRSPTSRSSPRSRRSSSAT